MRAEAERLPIAARESADAMRARAQRPAARAGAALHASARERRDVIAARGGGLPAARRPLSLTGGLRRHQRGGAAAGRRRMAAAPTAAGRSAICWRAPRATRTAPCARPVINIEVIARALDATTASAIWSRFRAGQRGIMVRSIYTAEGRATFDEISERYKTDIDFQPHGRPLPGRLRVAAARRRAEGPLRARTCTTISISDSGRVYLFLAHASGRLR